MESLSEIQHPSLVLSTTRDELHPVSVAETIADRLPNGLQHELPARYDHPLEYGLELNRVVADFLS